MIVNIGNDQTICFLHNGNMIELDQSKEWSYWMRNLQNFAQNTIQSFMKSMERFWIWSLHYPTNPNETLPFYLARYREDLQNGFEIIKSTTIGNQIVPFTIYKTKPMEVSTINKEFAGIKSYFFFIEDIHMMQDSRYVNVAYERKKSEYSFLSSVNMQPSDTNFKLSAKKREFLKAYKTKVKSSNNIKYFPLKYFDSLLELAQPRERLIYILCGICSARIGQALNLTIYDLDHEKQEVWLLDPKGDDKDIYGHSRRKWLKNEYEIDIRYTKPHNFPDLQFKYPIPHEFEPLHWVNPKYIVIFFQTLSEYVDSEFYLPEASRVPRHPFLFVTKTGNRLRTRETNYRFKQSIVKLKKIHNIKEDIEQFSIHSLRHMFGSICATLYAKTGDDAIIFWTKNAMGHASLESTMIYFKMDYAAKKELLLKAINQTNKERTNYETK